MRLEYIIKERWGRNKSRGEGRDGARESRQRNGAARDVGARSREDSVRFIRGEGGGRGKRTPRPCWTASATVSAGEGEYSREPEGQVDITYISGAEIGNMKNTADRRS
eukprot:scaffold6476_cov26-Tisochrysis_lutea.AAC.2